MPTMKREIEAADREAAEKVTRGCLDSRATTAHNLPRTS